MSILDDFIDVAAAGARLDLATAAAAAGLSPSGFCDEFARRVTSLYLSDALTWDVADLVMNELHTAAYARSEIGLSEAATLLFEAFDEGEYLHHDGLPDGEPRTRALLASALNE